MLLDTLRAAGLTVTATDNGQLIVGPRDRLTPALREQIVANKAALLALLSDTRTAPPYQCWKPGCGGVAAGPWRRLGPDSWVADCSGGHPIWRTAYSFTLEADP